MPKKRGTVNKKFKQRSAESDAMILWVHANRNKLTEISEAVGVSPQFVHMVSRGQRKSEGGKVERLLREAGAPIR